MTVTLHLNLDFHELFFSVINFQILNLHSIFLILRTNSLCVKFVLVFINHYFEFSCYFLFDIENTIIYFNFDFLTC